MAIKTFKVGKVTVNGTALASVENANLNIVLEPGVVTSIGDSWRKLIALAKSWSVTLTMKNNPSDSAQSALRTEFISGNGLVTALLVYEDATKYFSGSAYLTQYAPTKSVGSVDTLAVTFEGNGTLSYD